MIGGMVTNSKISANTLLNSLGSLSDKADYLCRLDRAVKALLSTDIAKHCQVANVRDNVLILHLNSAEWATQLHYQTTELLTQLHQQKCYAGLRSIQYKIRPVIRENKKEQVPSATPLSPTTRDLLRDTAKTVKDKELAAVLEKLSKR